MVTSDGLRTLLVLGGEAVPLSPQQSPSPTHRSPMHRSLSRSLTAAAGGSSGVGTFTNVYDPQAAAWSATDQRQRKQGVIMVTVNNTGFLDFSLRREKFAGKQPLEAEK